MLCVIYFIIIFYCYIIYWQFVYLISLHLTQPFYILTFVLLSNERTLTMHVGNIAWNYDTLFHRPFIIHRLKQFASNGVKTLYLCCSIQHNEYLKIINIYINAMLLLFHTLNM